MSPSRPTVHSIVLLSDRHTTSGLLIGCTDASSCQNLLSADDENHLAIRVASKGCQRETSSKQRIGKDHHSAPHQGRPKKKAQIGLPMER
eukprot:scaffold68_cov340-Pavlova_lutheri.AAC.7